MGAVDPATLQKLERDLGGEADVMRELIDTFLGEAPGLLAVMREGATHGRQRDINRAAHSLKSTAATFGAARLSQMCRELEELSARDVPADAAARAQAIEREWENVRGDLAKLRP